MLARGHEPVHQLAHATSREIDDVEPDIPRFREPQRDHRPLTKGLGIAPSEIGDPAPMDPNRHWTRLVGVLAEEREQLLVGDRGRVPEVAPRELGGMVGRWKRRYSNDEMRSGWNGMSGRGSVTSGGSGGSSTFELWTNGAKGWHFPQSV